MISESGGGREAQLKRDADDWVVQLNGASGEASAEVDGHENSLEFFRCALLITVSLSQWSAFTYRVSSGDELIIGKYEGSHNKFCE